MYVLLQIGESHRKQTSRWGVSIDYQVHGGEPTDRFLPSTLTTDCVEAAVLLLLCMGDCGAIFCHTLVC